jgi:hypothetical protein
MYSPHRMGFNISGFLDGGDKGGFLGIKLLVKKEQTNRRYLH